MSDTATAAPAKKAAPKEHSPVASMVPEAIKALADRKGSSLAAIKKHISANYKVDIDRLAPFIRKYLKKAVADGKLAQTKGTGATGSFKVNKAAKEEKPKMAAKKPAAVVKKPKSPAVRKPKSPAKATTPKKSKRTESSKTSANKLAKKTPKKASPKNTASKKTASKKAAGKPAAKKPAAKKPVAKKTAAK